MARGLSKRGNANSIPMVGQLSLIPYRSHIKGLIVPAEDGHNNCDFATVWLDR